MEPSARHVALVVAVSAGVAAVDCNGGPGGPGQNLEECSVQDAESDGAPLEQPLAVITPEIEVVIPSASGQRRCRPGSADGCDRQIADGCVITIEAGPDGDAVTVSIVVHNTSRVPLALHEVALSDDTDPSLSLLAPVPVEVEALSSAEVLLQFSPAGTDPVSGTLRIQSDAGNQGGDDDALELPIEGSVS